MSRSCLSNILSFCILVLIATSFPGSLRAQGRPDVVWMRGGHANSVQSMDYSPDGQLFVTVGDYGTVKIWRLSDGLMLRTLSVRSQIASFSDRVIFLPDSQTIAVSDASTSRIKIVRVSDGEILRTIVTQTGNDPDTTMKLMPDGTIFFATSLSVKFYRPSDGVLLRTITHIHYLRSNGQQVGFGYIAGKSFPTSNGSIGTTIQQTSGGPRYPVVISAVDGRMIGYHPREERLNGITKDGAFITSPNGGNNLSRIYRTSDLCISPEAAVCNPSTIPIVHSIQANGDTAFSSDGQTFAMISASELKLFNTSNWTLLHTIPRFFILQPFVFSPNSQTLATGGEISVSVRVRLVNFWNVTDGTLQGTLDSHFNAVLSVSFSANGQTVASYSAGNSQASTTGEGTVRIWNSANGGLIREIRTGQDHNFGVGPVRLVALSPDGQRVFNAAPNSGIQIWRISDGSLLRTIPTNCRGFSLSPDGQTIASINASYGIDLYRTSDGSLLRTIPLPGAPGGGILHGTRSVAFTPDGQTLIAGQLKVSPFKGFITFFRVSDGGVIRTVETLSTDVRSVAISPDGQTIASAGHGICNGCTVNPTTGIAELRRVSDGSLIRSFTEHEGRDYTVAFTPNGQYVCTSGGEAAIRFWRVSDGTLAALYDQELPSPTSINVATIGFSADGALFAYGRQDATLVLALNPFVGTPTPTPTPSPSPTPIPSPSPTPTPSPSPTPIPSPSPTPVPTPLVSNVLFDAALFNVSEGANSAAVTVTRTGATSTAVTVDYATSDGTAQQTSDYAVGYGTLSFVAGETSKTFGVIIIDDAYPEGSEVLNLSLSNPTGGAVLGGLSNSTLSIQDNDSGSPGANPIDQAQFFVRQHYYDFLNREPDAGGLAYWASQVAECATDPVCIDQRRVGVSAAYFIEAEFQETGSYVYRLNKASFGVRPEYAQFMSDRGRVVEGADREASKQAFVEALVQRQEFLAKYPASLDGTQFIDTLLQTVLVGSSVNLSNLRTTLISDFNANQSRARIVRLVADDVTFKQVEFNQAFVLMQYFGYLRRDPDQGGYLFWLDVVNNRVPGNLRSMVCAFLTSAEYQNRFSSVRTRTDQVCGTIGP